jgi:ABC-type branched-subunit amino acid transport system substrate-binding protein
MRRRHSFGFAFTLAAALPVAIAAACGGGPAPADDVVTVGLLLPFTGPTSATTRNFERAALYAADRVNAGGGIHGRRLRIVSRDTHDDLDRSRQSADELIADGAVVIVGPESADIAQAIAPMLADHQVAFLSPLVGAADESTLDCTHPWFRLAPSARSLGEALAKLAWAQGLRNAAVLHATDAYDVALSDAVAARFAALGGQIMLTLELDPNAQTYAGVARQTVDAQVGSIFLAAAPRTGALAINELEAISPQTLSWFLSPLLKTELLVANVAPEALEGALGVAPRIYDTSAAFPDAFSARWQGDRPLEGAYFYYDALGLLALALEKTTPAADGSIDVSQLGAAIQDAAAPPGEGVGWNEIELGLQRTRDGNDVYYSGLTGPMLLDACGSRQLGATSTWQVHDGTIAEVPQ